MEKRHNPLSIFIADHEPDVRQALRLVCEESLGLTIAAEAADSNDLLAQLTAADPDILLLEWELPGLKPSALINQLRTNHSVYVIVTGGQAEIRTRAFEAGADGFVYKGDPPNQLINLLRTFGGTQPFE